MGDGTMGALSAALALAAYVGLDQSNMKSIGARIYHWDVGVFNIGTFVFCLQVHAGQ